MAHLFKGAWKMDYKEDFYYKDKCIDHMHCKGIYHVGGGVDYWGEADELYTVLEAAEQAFWGWQSFCGCKICRDQFDPDLASFDDVCATTEKRRKLRPTYQNLVTALKESLKPRKTGF